MWNYLRQIGSVAQRIVSTNPVGKVITFPQLTRALSTLQWKPVTARSSDPTTYSSTNTNAAFGGMLIVPSRGMKIKGRVKRRCKDCYLLWVNGILHNRCKTYPRHTQKLKEKRWENERILTHATMGPRRAW